MWSSSVRRLLDRPRRARRATWAGRPRAFGEVALLPPPRLRGGACDVHATVVDLLGEERAHQLLVGAVPQRLRLASDGGGVVGGVGGAFLGDAPGEDLLGGPGVDGVGGDL